MLTCYLHVMMDATDICLHMACGGNFPVVTFSSEVCMLTYISNARTHAIWAINVLDRQHAQPCAEPLDIAPAMQNQFAT